MAKHNIFGQKGENAAFEALLAKGYLIRDRNWRSGKTKSTSWQRKTTV